jgi:hypothetical protein
MILHTLSSPITSPTTEFSKNFPKIWRALPPLTQFSKIIHGLRVAVRIFKNYPRVSRVPNFQILNTGCECTQPPRPGSPPFLSIPGPGVCDFRTRKIVHRLATLRPTVRGTAPIPHGAALREGTAPIPPESHSQVAYARRVAYMVYPMPIRPSSTPARFASSRERNRTLP